MARTDTLVAYENNARTHSSAQITKIMASIREFGFTNPVLTDGRRGIIAGHGRVLAALQLGIEMVPTMALSHLTAKQRRAYVLADNRLALDAGWDDELLALELGELRDLGFDLALTGFDAGELLRLFGDEPGMTDPEDVPETPAVAVTRLGDVWMMGAHRLICGDSSDAAAVATLMDGMTADVCFTSPPYAQQRDYESGGISDWDALMSGVFAALPPMAPAGQVLVNLGMVHRDNEWVPYWDGWIAWMRAQGWRRFGWYVWDQGPGLPGNWNGRLAPSHEFVFHFNRAAEGARKTKAKLAASIAFGHGGPLRGKDGKMGKVSSPEKNLQPTKIPDSVIRVMRHKGGLGDAGSHPAVFPVALAAEMLTAFSDPGDIAYEPFCGSGSTIIAAEKNGRSCHAIELAPAYVDVAVLRWQSFIGKAARLESTGQTFADVAADRAKPAAASKRGRPKAAKSGSSRPDVRGAIGPPP
jgi:DNA modification methylase